MISEDTLKKLLSLRTETKNLDYKQSMDWASASTEDKCELVKDILAMTNTQDGGQIIIGVEDKAYNLLGISDLHAASFDPTKVNDFVHKYTDPPTSCHVQKFRYEDKNFIVIDVPEFKDVPIICKADASSSTNKPILKRGGLYVRTEKPTSEIVSSAEEMRELLGRALLKRGDQLLRTIQGLISGRPIVAASELEHYRPELQAANQFFSEVLPKEVVQGGFWNLTAMPNTYAKERVPNIAVIIQALTASAVALRGWTFPHIDEGNARNFSQGRQSSTAWEDAKYYEAFRAYLSALFIWRASYWDDSPMFGGPVRAFSWVNIIFQITEFFVFLSRYYSRLAEDTILNVSIELTDTGGRALISRGDAGPIPGSYICTEPHIEVVREYSVSQLRASPEDAAKPVIRRIFETFQWTHVSDDLIQQRQRELIQRAH